MSLIHDNNVKHIKIDYGPGWYQLDGEQHPKFSELQELVNYYCSNPVSDEVTLGAACGKRGDMKYHNTG